MLEQLEAGLSALKESTEDYIWSVDLNFGLLTFNSVLERDYQTNFGTTAAVGKRPEDLLPPAIAKFWPPMYKRALEEGPFRVERLFVSGRTMELGLSPIVIDGKPIGVSVFGTDITGRRASEKARIEAERKYREIFDRTHDGMYQTTPEGNCLITNPAMADMLAYDTPEELTTAITDSAHQVWLDPADRSRYKQLLEAHGTILGYESQFKRKDGTIIWVSLSTQKVCGPDGQTIYYEGFVQNITDRKQAELQLRESEARYRTVFQTSLDSLSLSNLSTGAYMEANQAFLDLMGFTREELIGRTSAQLGIWVNPKERDNVVEMLRQNPSFRDVRARFKKKNGDTIWVLLSASLIEIEGATCLLGVTRDLSDTKAAEDEIWSLAFYDSLTRLPNRRLLLDRLLQALSSTTPSTRKRALLYIDLDDFKNINDTLGHQTGDLLLHDVARRLAACTSQSDTVGRFGADEFVVMLEDLGETAEEAADEAERIGENMLTALRAPFILADHTCRTTASIGITVFGEGHETPSEVLQQADIAMSQAKTNGGNSSRFFSPALQAAVNARAAMRADLSQAIAANQLTLYYQPQVDANGLIGAEALIRWDHPTRGLIVPDDFIPLAEETGIIVSLGAWALEAACLQLASWAQQKTFAHLQIAVNISARQFSQPNFLKEVLSTLDRTGANPRNLKLELTESMLVNDIEDVIAKMTTLKSHGLSFALDDFGTGYSSLSYLKRLPLDQLKIDRAFVQDILTDVASAAIAQTIIALGRAMGLAVIAEGVETEAQHQFLATLGTHSFQGYLFSRPLPLDEFERLWMHPGGRPVFDHPRPTTTPHTQHP